jgi:hypothetical protein
LQYVSHREVRCTIKWSEIAEDDPAKIGLIAMSLVFTAVQALAEPGRNLQIDFLEASILEGLIWLRTFEQPTIMLLDPDQYNDS